jgi:hypothetical protein
MAADGGAIEVIVNDPNDKMNTEAIRSQLSHIAMMFGNGDFSTPMFVHDGVPPGVTTMKLMKSTIHYQYDDCPQAGGYASSQLTRLLSLRFTTSFVSRSQIMKRATVLKWHKNDDLGECNYRCSHGRGKCSLPYMRKQDLSDRLGDLLKGIYVPDVVARAIVDSLQGD